MKVEELEDLLEETRQQIAAKGRGAYAELLDKERTLEQAVIEAYLDEADK
tara:strand:- start:2030 stop:2179 length:150 start_codon:yes stop_codon:yes gene_type:complete